MTNTKKWLDNVLDLVKIGAFATLIALTLLECMKDPFIGMFTAIIIGTMVAYKAIKG